MTAIEVLPLEQSPLGKPKPNHVRYVSEVAYVAKVRANMERVREWEWEEGNPNKELLLQYMEDDAKRAAPPELQSLIGPTWNKLYAGAEGCQHVKDPWGGSSGVSCLYCNGWFCF